MAIRLRQAGQPDFVILEKADGVGGTWRKNTYPGCACDVASPMYSYSFVPNRSWSRMYAGQPETLDYIKRVVKDRGGVDTGQDPPQRRLRRYCRRGRQVQPGQQLSGYVSDPAGDRIAQID